MAAEVARQEVGKASGLGAVMESVETQQEDGDDMRGVREEGTEDGSASLVSWHRLTE